MYLRCPECKTRYEISAARIPDGGARVRCPRCRTVFHVSRPLNGNGSEPHDDGQPEVVGESPERAFEPAGPRVPVVAETPVPVEAPTTASAEAPANVDASAPAEAPAPVALEPSERINRPPLPEVGRPPLRMPAARPIVPGAAVDSATARRIARAIVSDLASARREQRDAARKEGRVLSALGPVIAEAWDDYRRRVGDALATGTPHFREAVNEFLGLGDPLL
jgi:predicted Zn finger-like uncharacterized protein